MPSGIDQPFAAQDLITRIARRDLAGMCGEALAQLSEDGDAIYRIRHLHLELWVDLQGMSEANVARRWGRLLAGSAVRAMAHGSPGQVMRFESAQHFISAFLRDLIDGRAWHCWYYDEFKLLDRLPWPRLTVQLLVTRPHWIAPTLLELATTGHGHRLIEAWDQADIDALWQALGFPATPVLAPRAAEALPSDLAEAWRTATLSGGVDGNARARDRLRLWLGLASQNRLRAQDAQMAGVIHVLVDLAAMLRVEPELAPTLLMRSEPYPALLKRIAAGPLAEVLAWLPGVAASAAGAISLRRLVEEMEARSDRAVGLAT